MKRLTNKAATASRNLHITSSGNCFHYYEAARRCLRLLDQNSGLVAVVIEGASDDEFDDIQGQSLDGIHSSDHLIDFSEYYGNEDINKATCVRLVQVKYSIRRANETSLISDPDFKKTFEGFAQRFKEYKELPVARLQDKLRFVWQTNRPLDSRFHSLVKIAKSQGDITSEKGFETVQKYAGMGNEELAQFLACWEIQDNEDSLWQQIQKLTNETGFYCPGTHTKEISDTLFQMIAVRASEEFHSQVLHRNDILQAFCTTEEKLFPAKNQIKKPKNCIEREQIKDIIKKIEDSNKPVILHGIGGMGKSTIATTLHKYFSKECETVVFDCFAQGQYRTSGVYRHTFRKGLVQVANELAAKGLCDLLIPNSSAENEDYLSAFIGRLQQAQERIYKRNIHALVVIIIDAADNAVLAEQWKVNSEPTFVQALLCSNIPENIRLVFTCRSERRSLLGYKKDQVLEYEIQPFTLKEIIRYITPLYGQVIENQLVEQLRYLTSGNPRIINIVTEKNSELSGCISTLINLKQNNTQKKEDNRTLEAVYECFMSQALATTSDKVPLWVRAISVLPVPINLHCLAKISQTHPDEIRSFLSSIPNILLCINDSIEFHDENSEVWWLEKYPISKEERNRLIDSIWNIAGEDFYAARYLPILLKQGNRYDELMKLATSGVPWYGEDIVRKMAIEKTLFEETFSLAESRRDYPSLTKIALFFGERSASIERNWELISNIPDIVPFIYPKEEIKNLLDSVYDTKESWLGQNFLLSSAIYCGYPSLQDFALVKYQIAEPYFKYARNTLSETTGAPAVSIEDCLQFVWTTQELFDYERAWGVLLSLQLPFDFQVVELWIERLLSYNKSEGINFLSDKASDFPRVAFALMDVYEKKNLKISKIITDLGWKSLSKIQLRSKDSDYKKEIYTRFLYSLVIATLRNKDNSGDCSDVLRKVIDVLKEKDIELNGSRLLLIKSTCLLCELRNISVDSSMMMSSSLLETSKHSQFGYREEQLKKFNHMVSCLLPFAECFARAVLGTSYRTQFEKAERIANEHSYEYDHFHSRYPFVKQEMARIWLEIIQITNDAQIRTKYEEWIKKENLLLITENISLCLVHPETRPIIKSELTKSSEYLSQSEEYSNWHINDWAELIRASLPLGNENIAALYKNAVTALESIGDEDFSRWEACTQLAKRISSSDCSDDLIWRYKKEAEATYNRTDRDKHYDWQSTVEGLVKVSCVGSTLGVTAWLDLRFGNSNKFIPDFFEALERFHYVDCITLLPFCYWRGYWDWKFWIEEIAKSRVTGREKERALNMILHRVVASDQDSFNIKQIISLPEVTETFSQEQLEQYQINVDETLSSTNHSLSRAQASEDFSKYSVLNTIKINNSESFNEAISTWPNRDFVPFLRIVCPNIEEQYRIQFIHKLSERINYFHVGRIVHELLKLDFCRPGEIDAIKKMVSDAYRRDAIQIFPSTAFLDLSEEALVSIDLTVKEIKQQILKGNALNISNLDANHLFRQASLSVDLLSADDARSVLNDFFKKDKTVPEMLSEKILEWIGSCPKKALAYMLWKRLGDPKISIRWEAAHTVLSLCQFQNAQMISNLIFLAQENDQSVELRNSFPFYYYEAIYWFCLAISRALLEFRSKNFLKKFEFAFLSLHQKVPPHALLTRQFENILQQLGNVSISSSQIPPAKFLDFHQRMMTYQKQSLCNVVDWDLSEYWYRPLGYIFQIPTDEIAKCVDNKLDELFEVNAKEHNKDPRYLFKVYDGNTTYSSHGSLPEDYDWKFYATFHSLMLVIEDLRTTKPQVYDSNTPNYDELQAYLAKLNLTRPDGFWLSDFRDPVPDFNFNWEGLKNSTLTDHDILYLIEHKSQWTVWKNQVHREGDICISVSIQSALITDNNVSETVRELSATEMNQPLIFPIDSRQDDAMSQTVQKLKSWLSYGMGQDLGIDSKDPYAGLIAQSEIVPNEATQQHLGLNRCLPERQWRSDDGVTQFLCTIWDSTINDSDTTHHDYGRDARIEEEALLKLLEKTSSNLMLEIHLCYHQVKHNSKNDVWIWNRQFAVINEKGIELLQG